MDEENLIDSLLMVSGEEDTNKRGKTMHTVYILIISLLLFGCSKWFVGSSNSNSRTISPEMIDGEIVAQVDSKGATISAAALEGNDPLSQYTVVEIPAGSLEGEGEVTISETISIADSVDAEKLGVLGLQEIGPAISIKSPLIILTPITVSIPYDKLALAYELVDAYDIALLIVSDDDETTLLIGDKIVVNEKTVTAKTSKFGIFQVIKYMKQEKEITSEETTTTTTSTSEETSSSTTTETATSSSSCEDITDMNECATTVGCHRGIVFEGSQYQHVCEDNDDYTNAYVGFSELPCWMGWFDGQTHEDEIFPRRSIEQVSLTEYTLTVTTDIYNGDTYELTQQKTGIFTFEQPLPTQEGILHPVVFTECQTYITPFTQTEVDWLNMTNPYNGLETPYELNTPTLRVTLTLFPEVTSQPTLPVRALAYFKKEEGIVELNVGDYIYHSAPYSESISDPYIIPSDSITPQMLAGLWSYNSPCIDGVQYRKAYYDGTVGIHETFYSDSSCTGSVDMEVTKSATTTLPMPIIEGETSTLVMFSGSSSNAMEVTVQSFTSAGDVLAQDYLQQYRDEDILDRTSSTHLWVISTIDPSFTYVGGQIHMLGEVLTPER